MLFASLPRSSFVARLSPTGTYLEMRVPPDSSRLWLPLEEHSGKTIEEVLPEDLAKTRRFFFDWAVQTREAKTVFYPHPITDGRYMGFTITPVCDAEGNVEEVVMETFDITKPSRIPESYVCK
jgi:hypothetical protein